MIDLNICPICGSSKELLTRNSSHVYGLNFRDFNEIICHNAMADNPLHYYHHIIDPIDKSIAFLEFSLDLGHKHILVANNLRTQVTLIKNKKGDQPLELKFLITPDFPDCKVLKNKIQTYTIFS